MSVEERNTPGEIDLERLRAGFAARSPEPPSPAAGPCPEPGTIYDAVRGRLAPRELRAVVEHVAACPRCAQEWRLAMAFEEEAAAEDDSVPDVHPAAARPRSPLRLVSVAATLVIALLAAGVWYTVGDFAPEEAPVYRDAGPGEIVSLLGDGAALDRNDPVLRWRLGEEGAPEGTTYDVLVSTEDGAVVEADGLEEPHYALPAETVEALPPGTVLQWSVIARMPDGRRIDSFTFFSPLR